MANTAQNVPVDYTLRRYVKKPSGARPGYVIYTNQTTLFVDPDEAWSPGSNAGHREQGQRSEGIPGAFFCSRA